MVLVAYSDSESEGDIQDATEVVNVTEKPSSSPVEAGSKKRKASDIQSHGQRRSAPPPLPSSLHSLYTTNVRSSTSDDPSLHGGRHRQIPHVQGQWPSHVYLEWFPQKDELASLRAIISQAQHHFRPEIETSTATQINSFLETPLGVQLPLHVSLSAPLVLDTNEKDDFQTEVLAKIRSSCLRSFVVGISGLNWVANHDQTRHFLVLRLSRPLNDELNGLLRSCNQTCEKYGLPLLYHRNASVSVTVKQKKILQPGENTPEDLPYDADRSDAFHISIAWTLEKPSTETTVEVQSIWERATKIGTIQFTRVKIKVGNSVTDHALLASDERSRGFEKHEPTTKI